jgi:uncharacterized membrane protein YjgN (DUF898 family)
LIVVNDQIITGDSSMTGCIVAVLATVLLAYLLVQSWNNRTATDTTNGPTRQTMANTVAGALKIGALLALAIVLFAIMAVSVAGTRPHR